jgi:hypothetical protein
MKGLHSLAALACAAGCTLGTVSVAAEQMDITVCYSGTGTVINDAKNEMMLASWRQSGIITSNSQSKLLQNAVVRCEGVEHGFGEKRAGYGLCKIADDDGDVITAEIPYTGFTYDVKFLAGSGKWVGIKGSLRSERIVRSKPGKGAMPGEYQGCRREVGSFELSK